MTLWHELKRRNVVRVGTVYLAVAWLVTQVIDTVNEPLDLPGRFDTIVILLLAIGFPIALIVAWAFELTPDGVKRTEAAADESPAAPAPSGGRWNVYVTAILVLAVAALAVDRFLLGADPETATGVTADATTAPENATGSSAPALEDRIRVAVLPLRALSADESLVYFADGLSEQLIIELRQIPELLVPDRGASFGFRDSALSHREIADRLGVSHVLDGSLAGNGNDLRITVALERTADEEQLWQTTRDFSRAELFAVQDEIREQVATALSVSLGVLTRRNTNETDNVEAYTAYLTGRGYAQRFTPDALRAAIRYFQRAIALDSGFVRPRIALYFSHNNLAAIVPETEGLQARQDADETLALLREQAPDLAALGMIDAIRGFNEGNWSDVAAYLATQRDTPDWRVDESGYYSTLGAFLLRVGRIGESIRALETARALAPQEPNIAFSLASAYEAGGQLDVALAEIERGRTFASDNATLAGLPLLLALARRDPDVLAETIAAADSQLPMWADFGPLVNDREAGIAEVRRRFEEKVEQTPLAIGLLAHWANFFEAPELALEIVRSLPNNTAFVSLMIWDYGMRDARRLPEFRDLAADMGLVPYWREYGWPDSCHPVGDQFQCE